MATTTPNFGWAVPTSTDLVKDGAVAIETLGDSIDASLVDLKGGTTGQVLAKASNTDMDFTWSTPSAGASYVAGKNAVINGAMDIWQRGTSFTISSASYYSYTADRWNPVAGSSGRTASRQNSGLTGIQYCQRIARDSGNTNTSAIQLAYQLETADSYRLAGQTVTLSFYARAGANYSPTSSLLATTLVSGTSTDGNVNAGGLTTTVVTGNQTLTTSWQRFEITGNVSSAATQVGFYFVSNPTGTAGAADYYEITGVQLEIASTASTFSRVAGTLQGELAACQRYFQKSYDQATAPATANQDSGAVFAPWAANVGNGSPFTWTKLHQTMRTTPTLTIYSYGGVAAKVSDNNNTDLAANSATVTRSGQSGFGLYNNSGGTINTGNNGFLFHWTGSAEL
jgi:hypothetical protein